VKKAMPLRQVLVIISTAFISIGNFFAESISVIEKLIFRILQVKEKT
jgi:hypothetical protein